jgi:Zn-dependent protease
MRHPRNDAVLVSLAGPATNVLLAVVAGLWLRQMHITSVDAGAWRVRIPAAFGIVNVVLAVFNLIPVPPLDGSSVVARFLPKSWEGGWDKMQRYGMLVLIVVVLLRPTLLSRLFTPAINLWIRVIAR